MNASRLRFVVRVFFCCGLAAASLSVFGALPDALAQSTVSAQKRPSSVNRVSFMGTHLLTKGSSSGILPGGFLISQGNDADVGFDIAGVSDSLNDAPRFVQTFGTKSSLAVTANWDNMRAVGTRELHHALNVEPKTSMVSALAERPLFFLWD